MQNKKPVILIVLGVVAILVLSHGITSSPKGRRGPASGESAFYRQEAGKAGQITGQIKRRAKKTKFTSWARNPFLPRGSGPSAAGLTGILWDNRSPKAIIDDSIVGIGDKWGNNTVVDIKQDRVILNDGARDFELKLEQ